MQECGLEGRHAAAAGRAAGVALEDGRGVAGSRHQTALTCFEEARCCLTCSGSVRSKVGSAQRQCGGGGGLAGSSTGNTIGAPARCIPSSWTHTYGSSAQWCSRTHARVGPGSTGPAGRRIAPGTLHDSSMPLLDAPKYAQVCNMPKSAIQKAPHMSSSEVAAPAPVLPGSASSSTGMSTGLQEMAGSNCLGCNWDHCPLVQPPPAVHGVLAPFCE